MELKEVQCKGMKAVNNFLDAYITKKAQNYIIKEPMKALPCGGLRQNLPLGFCLVGMPAKQVSLSILRVNSRS